MLLAIGNDSTNEFGAFEAIRKEVQKKDSDIVLFRQDKCLDGEYVTFSVKDNIPRFQLIVDGKVYEADEFTAVLYLHPHLPKSLLAYDPAEHAQFIHRQFLELRRGLWRALMEKKWLNNLWAIQAAENKINQLLIATQIGMNVPRTLITSDPQKVREFYSSCNDRIITKILIPSPILDHVIYTQMVSENDLQHIDSVRLCPSIFQAYIEKKHELRITVVGDKIFCAKINSQENQETAVDWRRKPKLNDYSVRMEESQVPKSVSEKIKFFMKMIGLQYGCIDMIVTPSGEYIFLEINPSGQWYFVQLQTEMKIASAIVDLLM